MRVRMKKMWTLVKPQNQSPLISKASPPLPPFSCHPPTNMSSFRKRNVIISKKGEPPASPPQSKPAPTPGLKPSPVTGHATTSTGTESLDRLLGLGAGLALGTSLMIEEEGTTEFARSLLACYAAEGVVQGHAVFVVGPEGSLSLPGLAEEKDKKGKASLESEKMKIASR